MLFSNIPFKITTYCAVCPMNGNDIGFVIHWPAHTGTTDNCFKIQNVHLCFYLLLLCICIGEKFKPSAKKPSEVPQIALCVHECTIIWIIRIGYSRVNESLGLNTSSQLTEYPKYMILDIRQVNLKESSLACKVKSFSITDPWKYVCLVRWLL